MSSTAVPPTSGRLLVKRNGSSITRMVPKPVVLVDTREQAPFDLARFNNWIEGQKRATLPTGDYSVEGLEDVIAVERKSLPDLVMTLMHQRERFFRECERLAQFKYRAILIEATYEEVKSPYRFAQQVVAHPNGIVGTLDAIETRWCIPITYASSHRHLAEEKAASYLSKAATYEFLERQGLGRFLQEGDL